MQIVLSDAGHPTVLAVFDSGASGMESGLIKASHRFFSSGGNLR